MNRAAYVPSQTFPNIYYGPSALRCAPCRVTFWLAMPVRVPDVRVDWFVRQHVACATRPAPAAQPATCPKVRPLAAAALVACFLIGFGVGCWL